MTIVHVSSEGGLTLPPEAVTALNGAARVNAELITGGVALRPEGADRGRAPEPDAVIPVSVTSEGTFTLPGRIFEFMRTWSSWREEGGVDAVVMNDGAVVITPEHIQGPESLRKHYAGLALDDDEITDFSVQIVKEARAEARLEEQTAAREAEQAAARKAG